MKLPWRQLFLAGIVSALLAGGYGVFAESATPEAVPAAPPTPAAPAAPAVLARESVVAVAAKPAPAPGGTVFVLPIKGPIDKALLFVVRRAFRKVEEVHPAAIVVDMDTPGGGLRETEEIIAWMRSVKVPIYTFINTHAQSAGAIICLGSDRIYMAPGSRIGSALPILVNPLSGSIEEVGGDIKEKILSDTRSLVRGLAQEKGYSGELAMAMVDPNREVKIGDRVINPKGQILNLTAQEAVEIIPPETKPLLATAIVPNLNALLEDAGIRDAKVIRFEETSAERLARFITMFGPILFALGVLGIYIEFKTPGFGLPGILGGALLVLYFFGHYVAGLAGLEDIVLVTVGFVLLGIEVFVLPGHGVLGLLGILCIVAGLILGLIPHLPSNPTPLPDVIPLGIGDYIQGALVKVLGTLVIGGVGVWIVSKILPSTSVYRKLVLKKELSQDDGYVAHTAAKYAGLVGKTGVTTTMLRPAGIVDLEGERYDVVSSGDMIHRNQPVRVIAVQGSRIVVERAAPEKKV